MSLCNNWRSLWPWHKFSFIWTTTSSGFRPKTMLTTSVSISDQQFQMSYAAPEAVCDFFVSFVRPQVIDNAGKMLPSLGWHSEFPPGCSLAVSALTRPTAWSRHRGAARRSSSPDLLKLHPLTQREALSGSKEECFFVVSGSSPFNASLTHGGQNKNTKTTRISWHNSRGKYADSAVIVHCERSVFVFSNVCAANFNGALSYGSLFKCLPFKET